MLHASYAGAALDVFKNPMHGCLLGELPHSWCSNGPRSSYDQKHSQSLNGMHLLPSTIIAIGTVVMHMIFTSMIPITTAMMIIRLVLLKILLG